MMQMVSKLLGVALVAVALFMTCSRDVTVDDDDDAGTVAVVAANVSECGGFQAAAAGTANAEETAAEALEWAYVAGTNTLDLLHTGLSLNCCGVHAVDASYADGVVTVYENDQPEPEGRCDCMCDFDFRVAITGIPGETTGIRIMLTTDDETIEHWAGAIDPAEGSGAVVITTGTDVQ